MTFFRKIFFIFSLFLLPAGNFEAFASSAAPREDVIHIASLDFDNALYALNTHGEGVLQSELYSNELIRLGVSQIFYGSSRSYQFEEIGHVYLKKGESYTRFLEFHEALNAALSKANKAPAKFFPLIMEDVVSSSNIFSKKELREKGAFFDLIKWAKREKPEAKYPLEELSGFYNKAEATPVKKSRFANIGKKGSFKETTLSKKKGSCIETNRLETKEDMLFLQMQVAAHHYWRSPKEIYFHFYDDNLQYLTKAKRYFEAHRELIPSHVTLLLHHVGNSPFTDDARTNLDTTSLNTREGYSLGTIKGAGLAVPTVSVKDHVRRIQREVRQRK